MSGDMERICEALQFIDASDRDRWVSNCVETSGPALCLGLPWSLGLEHCVQDRQQLAHAGGQGDFGGFARVTQALVEGFDHRIAAAGRDGGHVQHRPHPGSATEDHPAATALAGIAVERADTDQRTDLPAVEGAQLRQGGQQDGGGHRADTQGCSTLESLVGEEPVEVEGIVVEAQADITDAIKTQQVEGKAT